MKFVIVLSMLCLSIAVLSCSGKNTDDIKSKNDQKQDTLTVDSSKIAVETIKLGESAQVVINTQKYDETIQFYESLGWKIKNSGDYPVQWTNMFDGSTVLLVVESAANAMGIGYNAANASDVYQELESNGDAVVAEANKKNDSILFKTYIGNDSVSFTILNTNLDMPKVYTVADILSNPDEGIIFPNPFMGSFQEFAVSVENLEQAMAYWEKRGFKSNGISDGPYRYTIMYDGMMILGLHETKGMWYGELLTYSGHGVEENNKVAEDLKKAGYKDIEMLEFDGQVLDGNYILHDPAGNALMMTTDFSKMKK